MVLESLIAISDTPISLGLSDLVVGRSIVPHSSSTLNPLITNVAGQANTALPKTLQVAGTTLRPGASGVTLDGTIVPLDTEGDLVVRSSTILPNGEDAGFYSTITIAGEKSSNASRSIMNSRVKEFQLI